MNVDRITNICVLMMLFICCVSVKTNAQAREFLMLKNLKTGKKLIRILPVKASLIFLDGEKKKVKIIHIDSIHLVSSSHDTIPINQLARINLKRKDAETIIILGTLGAWIIVDRLVSSSLNISDPRLIPGEIALTATSFLIVHSMTKARYPLSKWKPVAIDSAEVMKYMPVPVPVSLPQKERLFLADRKGRIVYKRNLPVKIAFYANWKHYKTCNVVKADSTCFYTDKGECIPTDSIHRISIRDGSVPTIVVIESLALLGSLYMVQQSQAVYDGGAGSSLGTLGFLASTFIGLPVLFYTVATSDYNMKVYHVVNPKK